MNAADTIRVAPVPLAWGRMQYGYAIKHGQCFDAEMPKEVRAQLDEEIEGTVRRTGGRLVERKEFWLPSNDRGFVEQSFTSCAGVKYVIDSLR